jgi:hypothetical protein
VGIRRPYLEPALRRAHADPASLPGLIDQVLGWNDTLFRYDLSPVLESVRDDVRLALSDVLDLL